MMFKIIDLLVKIIYFKLFFSITFIIYNYFYTLGGLMNFNFFKYFLLLPLSFLIVFIFNLFFVTTDFLAGKNIDKLSLIYSPVSNETWLMFWATLSTSIATIALLFHYKEELNFEKKKLNQNLILKSISDEKQIILETLSSYETSDISSIVQIATNENNIDNSINEVAVSIDYLTSISSSKIKEINLKRLKVELLTSLRIKTADDYDTSIIEKEKLKCYSLLTILHDFYTLLLNDSIDVTKKFLYEKIDILKNDNFLDTEKKELIDISYQQCLLKKRLCFLVFLDSNSKYLNKYFYFIWENQNFLIPDNSDIFNQLSEPDKNTIINFFKKYYPEYNEAIINKINLYTLFLPSIYVSIINSFFTDISNELTKYYIGLEMFIIKN